MTSDRSDELFNEGWREPSDDCERMAFYLMVAAVTLLGVGMVGGGLWSLSTGMLQSARLGGLATAVVGALITAAGGVFFKKESKHWDLRHLTADRFVAGGYLVGLALMLLGFQIITRSGSVGSHVHTHSANDFEWGFIVAFWLIGAGFIDLTFFLAVGLIFAYAPQMRLRHRWANVRVERRYAIDDKLNEIDDHPCPRSDGMTPVVTLRLRDGRNRTFVCAESAYELTRLGASGTAVVRGKRLERFHRS